MPLLLDTPRARSSRTLTATGTIEIALLNNLGDAGLKGGERQFLDVLSQAAEAEPVRLRLFSLPGIVRGPEAQARIATTYTPYAELMQSRVDGLIVTGCEPRTARLPQEPIWQALTEVIDWAENNTASTIFSCLAAHAAVLHLDGIERRPLARKCTGLFPVERAGAHSLLDGLCGPLVVPHSRWNELDERALSSAGYELLTHSEEVGVDMFVKQWRSLFVYLQGHPEYDEDALIGEYRRDVLRFKSGLLPIYPDLPRNCFLPALENGLRMTDIILRREPKDRLKASFAESPRVRHRPRTLAVRLFRNWITGLRSTDRKPDFASRDTLRDGSA